MVGSVVFNRLLLVPLAMGALYLFGGRGQLLLALVLLDLLLALLTLASLYGVKMMGPFARLECDPATALLPPLLPLSSGFDKVVWLGLQASQVPDERDAGGSGGRHEGVGGQERKGRGGGPAAEQRRHARRGLMNAFGSSVRALCIVTTR